MCGSLPRKGRVLILKYEKGRTLSKRAGGSNLLNQPRGRSLGQYESPHHIGIILSFFKEKILISVPARPISEGAAPCPYWLAPCPIYKRPARIIENKNSLKKIFVCFSLQKYNCCCVFRQPM